MRRVFLSYRRDDSQFITSFIHGELEDPAAFGPDSVFMDIDNIPPGVDFRKVINKAVGQCEFFLAVIGKQWATPRLMNPNDFVRLEIEAALTREIPVTPLLVDGAAMPREDQLPPSLHPLLYMNATTLRHGKDFKPDVLRLVTGLHEAKKWYGVEAGSLVSPLCQQGTPAVAGPALLQPEGLSPSAQASGLGTGIEVPSSLKGSLARTGETLSGSETPSAESPGRSPGLRETALRAEKKVPVKLIAPDTPKFDPPQVSPGRKAGDRDVFFLPGGVTMRFAWCPPGTFLMGSPESEEGRSNDEQQHEVSLTKGFWMGIHPVTQAQWKAVMGTDPSHFKDDTLPVETVSWDDSVKFCATLKQKTSLELRLPTEAEWEYAARGGTTTPFYWGSELNGTQANCDGNYPYGTSTKGPDLQKTTPVGSYAAKFPHPWGLCDVIGNVWEWCADWCEPTPKEGPTSPGSSSFRVFRGGCWAGEAGDCRAAYRRGGIPGGRRLYLGFRLAADPSTL